MTVRQADDGSWVASSGGVWLPGVYKTEKAARLACRVDPDALETAWEAKRGPDGIVPDDANFTEAEMRALGTGDAG